MMGTKRTAPNSVLDNHAMNIFLLKDSEPGERRIKHLLIKAHNPFRGFREGSALRIDAQTVKKLLDRLCRAFLA